MTQPSPNPSDISVQRITVGELAVRFIEACGVKTAYGVISIHNMPILDAINQRGHLRFVSARGEAGACNMADAAARVSGTWGVCITSTGTGAGNAAGALVEALTAGTPMLHLTGQIESAYVDRDWGYIHEAPAQLAMLSAVSKAAFRIRDAQSALSILREAHRLAHTAPCGPVSIEIPIDVQAHVMDAPTDVTPLPLTPVPPDAHRLDVLAQRLSQAQRPMLWLGGGARHAGAAVQRFIDMGWAVVTSVQGRGIVPEQHPMSLGAFNVQKPVEALYAQVDAMLVVGSRLRSNETLNYKLQLPACRYRIDANPLADQRAYSSDYFVQADASLALHALADRLQGHMHTDPAWPGAVAQARQAAEATVDATLGPYVTLKDSLNRAAAKTAQGLWWVRDITLSNSMWGNRSLWLDHPRAGVHALGGGIGQGLAMGIGASLAAHAHALGRKTVALVGDGGLMLNPGELACAMQEKAQLVLLVMNDQRYGVIQNIQDAIYGGRRCYVDLCTPDFSLLCASLKMPHFLLSGPENCDSVLAQALAHDGPVMVEVDMTSWGPFATKFAGPPRKDPT
ncbi:MAG: thiamine pyrophosphate-binding protein [Betaproteobacteria bacterium]|nr:thiamine pyrophosphate-binding protein [Betaproteobacteria bacterium]